MAQTTEVSCGAAALATLLNLYFGIASTEQQVLDLVGDQIRSRGEEASAQRGLTAYDLKQVARSLGLRLAGYKLNMQQLQEYFARGGLPVIAHVAKPCLHYLLIVGFARGHMLLCDPGWGRSVVRWHHLRYERAASGVFLVAVPTGRQRARARKHQAESLKWMHHRLFQLQTLREVLGR